MERIIKLLKDNNYKENTEEGADFRRFFKNDCFSIDLSENEIVFIDDTGDFLHIPCNYYALLGVLLNYRQMSHYVA